MADNYCVYIHTSPDGKKYVGITKQNTEKRWRRGLGYRRNKHFFCAILMYGWENFEHEVYAENLTQENAEELEQFLIAKHRSKDRRYGYNHTDGGDGTQGCFPSAEARAKMSQSRMGEKNYLFGKHLSEDTKSKMSEWRKEYCKDQKIIQMMRDVSPNKKQVYQYSIDGELVRVWDSRHQAENEFIQNKKSLAIGKCCQGDCLSAYGFVWSYTQLQTVRVPQKSRKVFQYNADATELICEWENLDVAAKTFREGKNSDVIRQCISGHRPIAYGYYWSYVPQLRGEIHG